MREAEARSEPAPGEALATLQRLAEAFFDASRPPGEPSAKALEASPAASAVAPEFPSGTVILDHDDRIAHLDGGAEKLFLCETSESAGTHVTGILGPLPDEGATERGVGRRRDGTTFA